MPLRRFAAAALLLALVFALATGCSKGTKSTNPAVLPLEMDHTLAPGAVFEHAFATSGAYAYHCSIHPSMTGLVIVSPSAPAADSLMSVDITSYAFTQSSVTIPVGGKVKWTNLATITHTVTSD